MYPTNRMKQRVASWWQNSPHCSYAYNYKDLSTAVYQPGGTAILSMNASTCRVSNNSLADPEGLGRWTSTLYNGKNNQKVRIIQVYCPALPTETTNNSTYAQHHRYFLTKNITECPRKLFFQHLQQFVSGRMDKQEQIIIMGDFNHSLESTAILQFQTSLNLHNMHKTLYSNFNTNIPTYDRGSQTIDAIFASQGITAIKGGFLDFQRFPTDHRALWLDLDINTLFGQIPPNITPPNKRRLQCEDPRAVSKFCAKYKALIKEAGLPDKVSQLIANISGELTPSQQLAFESIDKIRTACALKAEKKCRKFKMGGVEYSPKMQFQRDRISLWKAVISKKRGNKVSTRLLTRLEKRICIYQILSRTRSPMQSRN